MQRQERLEEDARKKLEENQLKAKQAQERRKHADFVKEEFRRHQLLLHDEKLELAHLRQLRMQKEAQEKFDKMHAEAEAKAAHIKNVRIQLHKKLEQRKREIIERALD